MGSQRVGHDWATELNWTEDKWRHWQNHKHLGFCVSAANAVPFSSHIEETKKLYTIYHRCALCMDDREAFDWHLPQTKGSRLHVKATVDSFSVQASKQPTPGILSRKGFCRGSWVLTDRHRHQGLIQTCALWPYHYSSQPKSELVLVWSPIPWSRWPGSGA